MKIVSYNISLSNSEKVKTLFEENADVYVVPEIAEEDLPSEFSNEWNGIHYDKPFMGTKSKGLGIIWREGAGKIPGWYNDDLRKLKYAIPLEYDGKLILAFWPTKDKTNGTYTKIAESIIEKYIPFLEGREVIISGDFNLFFKPSFANIEIINKKLKDFKSVYHIKNNLEFGQETEYTFFQKKKDVISPFFLDYTYTNIPENKIKMYGLIDFGRKFSDHVGQIIKI